MNRGLPPISIRQRLFVFLVPAILLIVAIAATLTYRLALSVATAAYDRGLLDPALDIAAHLRVGPEGPRLSLLVQAQEALLFDHEDSLIFQVRDADGNVVAGTTEVVAPPSLQIGERHFIDGVYRGDPIRIAVVRDDNGLYIQVGETLNKRKRLIWQIVAAALLPICLIALSALAAAWFVIRSALGPMAKLRTGLLGRTPTDLRPLDERGAPTEIAPVVKAFNALLGQLSEARARQQRFLADAAHQLRTPLAGLQMHLELLLRRRLAPDIRDQVAGMHVATVRASHMATQLLALAKAEAADSTLGRLRPIDLYTIADQAVQGWVPRAIARNIDLGFVIEHAMVAGDGALLSELLDNLLDNALRYTPQGGTVTVRTGHDGARAFLSVEDSGPGVPEWAQTKVFERFFRLDGSPGDGTGLGLAIVKEVVDQHGASLRFDATYTSGAKLIATFPGATATSVRAAVPVGTPDEARTGQPH